MRKLLVLLSLAALFLAGCGDGDDGSTDTAKSSKDSTTDSSADDADASTDSTLDTDFSGKGSGDFCELAKKYEEDFADTGDASTQEEVKKQYTDLTAAIDKLVSKAPSEIKADASKVNDKFKEVNTLLAKYDYDFSKIPQDEAEKISIDDPEIQSASDRIESYFEKVCKIDTDEDGDTDGVIGDSSSTDDEQAPGATTSSTEG
jgi:hypothetical protein